jgi:hypothetical protein
MIKNDSKNEILPPYAQRIMGAQPLLEAITLENTEEGFRPRRFNRFRCPIQIYSQ